MGGSVSIAAGLSVFVLHCFKKQKDSEELKHVVAVTPEKTLTNPGYNEDELSPNTNGLAQTVEGSDLRKRTASCT